jgi:hypothetical protein
MSPFARKEEQGTAAAARSYAVLVANGVEASRLEVLDTESLS